MKQFDTTVVEVIDVWPCGCKSINGSRSRHSDACRKRWLIQERTKRATVLPKAGEKRICMDLAVSSSHPSSDDLSMQWSLGYLRFPSLYIKG